MYQDGFIRDDHCIVNQFCVNCCLFHIDIDNRNILNDITTAVSILCLDCELPSPSAEPSINENQHLSISAGNAIHGGGSHLNSCNRWFDKTIQFVVSRNGYVGCCFEHSAAEGPPVQLICNQIIEDSKRSFDWNSNTTTAGDFDPPKYLQWKVNEKIANQIDIAQETLDSSINDLELKVIQFRSFGKNIPKRYRLSPDAFIQIGLQVAYYRIHNHIAPTYESAGTRIFKEGRTETIRSGSTSALRFCKSIIHDSSTVAERRDLMLKAIAAHSKYTKEAVMGHGVDRHLLGLKLIAMESKIPLPNIFRDHAFNYSLTFKLSTSQIPSTHDTVVVFGPSSPDGYGVCYNPLEDHMNFAVTAHNSNPETQAGKFGASLTTSLEEMHALLSISKL